MGNKHQLQNKEFYCYAVTEKKDTFDHEAQNATDPVVSEEEFPIQVQQILSPMSPNFQMILMQTPRPLHQQGLMLLETPVTTVGIALLPLLSIFYMETISVSKAVLLMFS